MNFYNTVLGNLPVGVDLRVNATLLYKLLYFLLSLHPCRRFPIPAPGAPKCNT